MKVAAILALYTVMLALVPGRLLARAAWPARAPRWGVAAWLALSAGMLLAATSTGLALLVADMGVSASLSGLLRECVMALRAQYQTPHGALAAAIGTTLAVGVGLVSVLAVARELFVASRARTAHRTALALAGRRWDAPSCRGGRCASATGVVVDHHRPVAYCLPGRGGRIVLSSAALTALDPAELDAVLAHERAHLAGRHHLLLAISAGLARAFCFVPLLTQARTQTAVLVEMLADDRACREGEPLIVASALLSLASPSGAGASSGLVPMVGALGATETATGDRVRRLLAAGPALPWRGRSAAATGSLLVVMTPLALLVAPALVYANTAYCPV